MLLVEDANDENVLSQKNNNNAMMKVRYCSVLPVVLFRTTLFKFKQPRTGQTAARSIHTYPQMRASFACGRLPVEAATRGPPVPIQAIGVTNDEATCAAATANSSAIAIESFLIMLTAGLSACLIA